MDADIAITYYVGWRCLWEERFKDPLSDAESFRVDAGGRLLEIGARPLNLDEIQGQYMGLLRFTPAGWRSARSVIEGLEPHARDKLDVTSMLQRMLGTGARIATMPVSEPWYEVDSQSDLELYEDRARRGGGRLF
jgi:choline kinase